MSMPRMSSARATASSGVSASLTPPALPRPPAWTWALTTTRPPCSSAAAAASSAFSTTVPTVTGTPCLAKSSFAWYSIRSTGYDRPLPGVHGHRAHGSAPGGSRLTLAPAAGPATIGGFRTLRHMPPRSPAVRVRSGDVSLGGPRAQPGGARTPDRRARARLPRPAGDLGRPGRRLPLDDWHVVTYDVRGAGSSDAPASREGYLCARLVDDLVAVLDARARPRCGSCTWSATTGARSSCGTRSRPRRTTRGCTAGSRRSRRSARRPSTTSPGWPGTPAAGGWPCCGSCCAPGTSGCSASPSCRCCSGASGTRCWAGAGERREGLPRGHWGAGLGRNAVQRARALPRQRAARSPAGGPVAHDVPVLVIQPERDHFITDVFLQGLHEACDDLRSSGSTRVTG